MPHLSYLTWCDGPEAEDALLRIGGLPDTIAHRTIFETVTAAYAARPETTGPLTRESWGPGTLVPEPNGFQSSRLPLPAGLSRDGRATSVSRNANGDAQIVHTEYGRLVTVIDPCDPEEEDGDEEPAELALRWRSVAEANEDWRAGPLRCGYAARRLIHRTT